MRFIAEIMLLAVAVIVLPLLAIYFFEKGGDVICQR